MCLRVFVCVCMSQRGYVYVCERVAEGQSVGECSCV